MTVRFLLNGDPVVVEGVDHHVTLLQWLRASGKTGTKEGCAEGECGACAVAVLGSDAEGRPRLQSINSCLVSLPSVHEHAVVTVEGVALASGELHHVQKAMVDRGGSQCGYCTPGFVVSLFCEYYRPDRAEYDPEAIGGNLCRCTGYRPIADVARALPLLGPDDATLARLGALPELTSFEHHGAASRFARPSDLPELWRCLRAWPDAVLLAGGTDLMVDANLRYKRFPALVSLDGVRELSVFEVRDDEVTIGAGLRLSDLDERLRSQAGVSVPLFAQLLPLFSSRLVRNRATLGGNLGTASPIGDALPVLLALDAGVTLASAGGERRLAVGDFLRGYRTTALEPGEVIVSVHLPRPLATWQRFYKVSKRVLDDISSVSAAFALDLTPDGRVARLRAAYGGVAATPLSATDIEQAALGRPWSSDTLADLLLHAESVGTPLGDHRGSAAYRRAMTGALLQKFFAETKAEMAGER